jgi:hypothetical protein
MLSRKSPIPIGRNNSEVFEMEETISEEPTTAIKKHNNFSPPEEDIPPFLAVIFSWPGIQ